MCQMGPRFLGAPVSIYQNSNFDLSSDKKPATESVRIELCLYPITPISANPCFHNLTES
jgi:hypothetical protein